MLEREIKEILDIIENRSTNTENVCGQNAEIPQTKDDAIAALEKRIAKLESDVSIIKEILKEERTVSAQSCRDIAILRAKAQ